MALEFRFGRDGKLIPNWYGRYEVNGRRHTVDLGVAIGGTPPEPLSLRSRGDEAFELSRQKAKDKLDAFADRARGKQDAAHLVERIYEIKTGEKVQSVGLETLPDEWERIPRRRKPNARYAVQCRATLARFVQFVRARYPKIEDLGQVTRSIAREYLESELTRGVAAKTWNDTLKRLRATCKYLLPAGSVNPFTSMPTRAPETVFRKPFSCEELQVLLDAAREDAFMYPLIVTAACSGMRRGDVCGLRWSAVDLKGGMLEVKTSKTGANVEIPIFKPLQAVLEARKGVDPVLVFPEAARMLVESPDGLTWRFKKIVAQAFDEEPAPGLPHCTPAGEVLAEGEAAICAKMAEGPRRERVLDVFRRYCGGASLVQIAKDAGYAKCTVSLDLHTVQDLIGKPFIRIQAASMKGAVRAATQVQREHGQRAASVRDWHALRATFVTLALSAGVPVELVRRVTGHATVEVVLKHYFRPDREQFKAALTDAMPAVLTGGRSVGSGQSAVSSGMRAAQGKQGAAGTGMADGEELVALAVMVAKGTATAADRARLAVLAARV